MMTNAMTVKPSKSKRNAEMAERIERAQTKAELLAELDGYLVAVRRSDNTAALLALAS